MPRNLKVLLLLLLIIPCYNLVAQQAKGNGDHKTTIKIFKPNVYLGNSDYNSGPIKKNVLDNLLKQGLTSHDSTGKKYKVIGFDFTYAERDLYEDEVGNLIVTPEYLNQHCDGDTLASEISGTIYDRTKAGDTLFIDNVLLVRYNKSNQPLPDTTAFLGKGIKLYITK